MDRHRGVAAVCALTCATALLGVLSPPVARASCVGAVLAVGDVVDDADPPASGVLAAGGQDVTVSGLWFRNGCDDTSSTGPGCSGPPASGESPMRDVDLVLDQAGSSWTLGTEDAAPQQDRYAVTWTARVPDGVRAGPATLRAGGAVLPVQVTR